MELWSYEVLHNSITPQLKKDVSMIYCLFSLVSSTRLYLGLGDMLRRTNYIVFIFIGVMCYVSTW